MSELWKALIARLVYWLTPNAPIIQVQTLEPPLKPGTCECGHERCVHIGGKGRCAAEYPLDKEWPHGSICLCQIFILDDDDDDENEPETPSPEELERLYQR